MARAREVVRVVDFGLAQRHGVQSERVDGTPHYAAPERVQGGIATVSTDVYALGVLGYQLLAGTLPFNGSMVEVLMAQVYDEPEAISSVRGEAVDPAIEALIRHAMAKDPAQRHARARAFRYELNTVMDMLALNRKRQRSAAPRSVGAREATVSLLFDKSGLPQALLTTDGVVAVANEAFGQLIGQGSVEGMSVADTALVGCVPDFLDHVSAARDQERPIEVRAHVEAENSAPLDLSLWLVPFSDEYVHVLVRYVQRMQARRESSAQRRQQNRERRAHTDSGPYLDISTVSADDLVADREAEPGAIGTRGEERLENAG
jgi:serine/threonine protein kinase